MTCIVGVVDSGTVYIGGDSCGSNAYSQTTRADQKVWSSEDFVFGFTSSFRMGQLLRYKLEVPEQRKHESVEEYLCGSFIDAVRTCLRDGGYMRTKDTTAEEGGCFLVGYHGRLFTIQRDFQVGESSDGWDAIGAGDEVARGVLHATSQLAPEERIRKALEAAEYLSVGVRRPFVIERLDA